MQEQNWLKYGVIALAAVGLIILIGLAFTAGGDLENKAWFVEEMTVDGQTSAPLEGTVMTATFEDGTVAGIATCNNYFGSYETKRGQISIGQLGTTLMACVGVPGSDAQEAAFLGLLESADRFDVDGETLTLESDGEVVLRFAEAVPEQFEG
ncbi:MAG: META domain-containing protein [Acidimicrobiia bacterium]